MGLLGDAWDWAKGHPGTLAGSVLFPGLGTAVGYGLDETGVSDKVIDTLGDVVTPSRADLGPLRDVIGRSLGSYDAFNKERKAFGGEYDPTRSADIYGQQQAAISQLAQAAAGNVPSPAELQMRQAADRGAAQSFGLASALQGRSPGGALRNALQSNASILGRTNADAGILRARETADARGQLVGALQGVQQQNMLQRQLDEERRRALLQGQIGALGAAGGSAGNYANASAADAAGLNALRGGIINTGAGLLARGL